MTTKNIIFTTLVSIALIAPVIFVCKCNHKTETPEANISLTQSQLDSIIKKAATVDIQYKDTIIYKDKIVINDRPVPYSKKIDDSTRYYTDHFVNGDIDITINDSIKGTLIKRNISYIPIEKRKEITVSKNIPLIVPVPTPEKYKLSVGAIVGYDFNNKDPTFGIDLGIINKKDIGIYYMYQTDFLNQKIHSIKITKNFKF